VSVGISFVGKKNITDGFTDGNCAPKKKFPLEYTDGFIPSVIVAYLVNMLQLSVKCRRKESVSETVSDCGISCKYFSTLCEMSTDTCCL
jgi:hypothetical protein